MSGFARGAIVAGLLGVSVGGPAGVLPARAQSVFALGHLGLRVDGADAHAVTLGGAHVSVPDSLAVLQENPAMLAWIDRVTVGVDARGVSGINRTSSLSDREGTVDVPAIGVGFTVRRTLHLGVAYRARTSARAAFSTPRIAPDGTPYVERFERSGGLFAIPVGAALALGRYVRVGGYVSYEVGAIDDRWTTDFDPADGLDAQSTRRREFRGTGWGGGVALTPRRGVLLAVAYDARVRYDTDVSLTHTNALADSTAFEVTEWPERWSATLRVSPTRRTAVTLAGATRDTRAFQGSVMAPGRRRRQWIVSLGYEQGGVIGALPVRASVAVEQLPWELGGASIRRVAVALGTRWTPPGRRAKFDVGVFVERVGRRARNGFETSGVGLVIGLSGAETWRHHREDI